MQVHVHFYNKLDMLTHWCFIKKSGKNNNCNKICKEKSLYVLILTPIFIPFPNQSNFELLRKEWMRECLNVKLHTLNIQ